MAQTLQREEDGERLLLTELSIEDGRTTLVMLAPFGLSVAKGTTLQVDEGETDAMPFFTCLPTGCLVRETMSDDKIAALRSGARLTVTFTVADTGEPFSLSSSLDGFSAANMRLSQLSSGPDSKQPPK